jgi:predicted secreted hydrolase
VKSRAILLGCVLFGATAPAAPSSATQPWRTAGPDHAWSFPRDHHAHPAYRNEWWYVTGQLAPPGATEPAYGFQVTLFRLGLMVELPPWRSDWAARDLVLGHAAVTDLRTGRHLFSEVLTRAGPERGGFPAADDSVLAWCRGPAGTAQRWSVRRREDGFAVTAADAGQGLWLDLALAAGRGPIFQGPGGHSIKDPASGAGSLYYSHTRLAAKGRLAAGTDTLAVTGGAWLDREIFTRQLAERHRGWDWFSLQFDDGRDLMLFVLRGPDGAADTVRATVVDAAGGVRWLEPAPDAVQALRHWTSPVTGARYPVAWRLRLPAADLDLEVAAVVADQENRGPRTGVVYWEGAIAGAGCRGFAELTGYDPGGRLPF